MKMRELTWPEGIRLVDANDRGALAQALATQVADWLKAALLSNDRASLAVSGGRTPALFFEVLSRCELPWSRVDVTLVDERWVAPDHADSNERMVREHLLQGLAAQARFVGMKTAAATAVAGQAECESALATIHWPLDVVILGMGNDGHTASLFPEAETLEQAMDLENTSYCVAVQPPAAPHERMTLTRVRLAQARHVVIYAVGEDKAETLEKVLAAPERLSEMPVRAFMQPGLQIFWSV